MSERKLREALNAVYEDLAAWQLNRERSPVGPYAYRLMDRALHPSPPTPQELTEVLQAAVAWSDEYKRINNLCGGNPHWVDWAKELLEK